MESKELISDGKPPRSHRRACSFTRRTLILFGIFFALIIIALAIGLGVGITKRNNDNNDNNMGIAGSTPYWSPSPYPSGPYTNNGVWQPPVNASWQIILSQTLDVTKPLTPDADVWDLDLFATSPQTISALHAKGKHVVCYFSAGSLEDWRPDFGRFQLGVDNGTELDGWPGESWLNTDSQNVRNIMADRIKMAASNGCDGIDPDNVDGYDNGDTGFNLTPATAANYVQFLASTAARYRMATGLKNAQQIIPTVLPVTQFSVNEQCGQYDECSKFTPYIQAGKPVFHIEYPKGDNTNNDNSVSTGTVNNLCGDSGSEQGAYDFSTILKNMNLDAWTQVCNGTSLVTPTTGNGGKVGQKFKA